jgi:hypothetical protein
MSQPEPTPGAAALNPWSSIWLRPRRTVRELVSSNPEYGVTGLAMLAGVFHVLDRATGRSAGDRIPFLGVLLMAALLGPVLGLAKVYLGAALLGWTGRWIGGSGTSRHLRTALAWGGVPYAFSLPVWLPLLLVVGPEMFTTETPRIDGGGIAAWTFFSLVFVQIVLGVWAFILVLKGVGEIQGFSSWRALANLALAGLVMLVPILTIVAIAIALRP